MIGLEFGSDTLKLAVCVGGEVRKTAVMPMPGELLREGRILAPAALAAFLKQSLKAQGIRGGDCALVLPGEAVTGRCLTLPVMEDRELRLNLPFEFRDFLDSGKYRYDYQLQETGEELRLYAAAVPGDLLQSYEEVLGKAGLRLKTAVPAEIAWGNLLRDSTEKLCILDAGHRKVRAMVFAAGNYRMGRDMELAGEWLDQVIAAKEGVDIPAARGLREKGKLPKDACETLAREVLHFLNFDTEEDGSLETLCYCGGLSQAKPLQKALELVTGLNLCSASTLLPGAGDALQRCGSAVGAALLDPAAGMNFARRISGNSRKLLPWLLAGILAAAVFAKFGILDPLNQSYVARAELEGKQALLTAQTGQLTEYDALEAQYRRYTLEALEEAVPVSRTAVLALAAEVLPPAKVEELTLNQNVLTLCLGGLTLEQAGTLMEQLEEHPLVTAASIYNAAAQQDGTTELRLRIDLEGGGDHE